MKLITCLNLQVRNLLEYSVLQYMFDAITEKPKLAKIYVDDVHSPKTCVLRLKHLLFIGGEFSESCLDFLENSILTDELRKSLYVGFVFYPNKAWEDAVKERFAEICSQYERSLFHITPHLEGEEPGHSHIVRITGELMNSGVDNLDMITDEVLGTATYHDMDDFFERGIGFAPVIDNKVCGFCTSEYPSQKAVAIGIEVIEEHQRQGLAKCMTQKFLYIAAQRSLQVYWECWKNNVASVNTALSCGFEKVADYPMIFLKF